MIIEATSPRSWALGCPVLYHHEPRPGEPSISGVAASLEVPQEDGAVGAEHSQQLWARVVSESVLNMRWIDKSQIRTADRAPSRRPC